MLNSKNPIALQFELSSCCNLKCQMCPLSEGKTIANANNHRFMKGETFEKVFQVARDVRQAIVVGFGEIFLHPRVKDILALLDRSDVGFVLSTNGTTLSKEICNFLSSLSNLQGLNVSVDSFDPEIYRAIRGKSNQELMQGLRNLSNSKVSADLVTLSFVCLNSNFHLIAELPDKVKKMRFNRIFLQSIVDHTNRDTRVSITESRYLYKEFLKQCKEHDITVSYCGRQTLEEQVIGNNGNDDRQSQTGTKRCLVPWEIPYIDSGGKVFACCHQACYDTAVLGDLNEDSFSSIWLGEKLRKFRRDLLSAGTTPPGCRKCHIVRNGIHPLIEWNAKFVPSRSFFVSSMTVVVCYQNIGKRTWSREFPIRIGTSYPRDRLSRFVTKNWIYHNRVAGFNEQSVAPGDYATFKCNLKKNKYVHNCEIFQLVFDGELWFPNSEIIIDLDRKTINPVAPYGKPKINNSEPKQFYKIIIGFRDLVFNLSGIASN